MLIRREEGDEREEGDVDQKHQIFSPPSSSRIALARADAPIPKCPGTSAIEISISGFKRKVNISIDGFEQRPLFPVPSFRTSSPMPAIPNLLAKPSIDIPPAYPFFVFQGAAGFQTVFRFLLGLIGKIIGCAAVSNRLLTAPFPEIGKPNLLSLFLPVVS